MRDGYSVKIATDVAWKFLGKPYLWGGDDPFGFDCSGFVIEILKSVGKLPRNGDWTASGLYERFKADKRPPDVRPLKGYLVFWCNDKGKIIHVEYCLDAELAIGASGGGSRTQTVQDAIRQNAYIKIRPFGTRSGLFGFVDPFLEGDK